MQEQSGLVYMLSASAERERTITKADDTITRAAASERSARLATQQSADAVSHAQAAFTPGAELGKEAYWRAQTERVGAQNALGERAWLRAERDKAEAAASLGAADDATILMESIALNRRSPSRLLDFAAPPSSAALPRLGLLGAGSEDGAPRLPPAKAEPAIVVGGTSWWLEVRRAAAGCEGPQPPVFSYSPAMVR